MNSTESIFMNSLQNAAIYSAISSILCTVIYCSIENLSAQTLRLPNEKSMAIRLISVIVYGGIIFPLTLVVALTLFPITIFGAIAEKLLATKNFQTKD